MKLKMINRLGQIDEGWMPLSVKRKVQQGKSSKTGLNDKLASTNHDTNILTLQSFGSTPHLQQSIILSLNPQQNDQKITYTCHQIREQLIQQLTEYNRSRYAQQMKQHSSKYNQSVKSMFYSLVGHEKKLLYEFCYQCDEVLDGRVAEHSCKNKIDCISKANQALIKLKKTVQTQQNKLFCIFLHNALQPDVSIDELITNVTVLKQSVELKYEPQEAVLRMRLMNLIGKKIGLLIDEKELDERLKSLWKSRQ